MKKQYTKQGIKNELNNINFNSDVHSLSFSELNQLAETAKRVGYRAGKNRNYSTGVAFFLYLNK